MKKSITKEDLLSAINQTNSNEEAAKLLNISTRTLYRLKQQLNEIKTEEKKEILVKANFRNPIVENESLEDRLIRLHPEKYKEAILKRREQIQVKQFTPKLDLSHTPIIISDKKDKEINHFVIADMQIQSNTNISHFPAIIEEILERLPDVIVFLGDWWDMKSIWYKMDVEMFDSLKYKIDIKAGYEAMKAFMIPLIKHMKNTGWAPRVVFCEGNHEGEVEALANKYKALRGLISNKDFGLEDFGIELIPFLKPVIIDDIAYCHYFTHGLKGEAVTSCKQLIKSKLMNCVMGHKQKYDIDTEFRADGSPIYAIFAGCSYIHNPDYLEQKNVVYSRLVWALNEVKDKTFHPEMLYIHNLIKKYNRKHNNTTNNNNKRRM